jgi:peptidoglycan hydrolase-like protein with peptidoglycan-binding domain
VKKAIAGWTMLVAGLLALLLALAVPLSRARAAARAAGAPAPTDTPTPTASPTPTDSPTPAPAALKVVSVTPSRNAGNVLSASAVKVTFSAALATDTPHPKLSPSVPGSWKLANATTLVFKPAGHLPLYATVRVTVPAGSAGVRAADGGVLAKPYTSSFTVGGASSVVRLQQLLAELGYLPLRFHPAGSTLGGVSALSREPGNPDLVSPTPLKGSFTWRWSGIPKSMVPLWKKGQYTALIRGAVMAFESGHGLSADGTVGRKVWLALLSTVAAHRAYKGHYDYVLVDSGGRPQTLSVWQDGRVIYRTPANTGISSRPTDKGTFPVYERYRTTTMSGTNPDGSHYSDPGIPYVAYFNGGDAVHGFIRGSYGSPQSLGCVELSFSAATVVYRYDPIGTLVTVY